MNFSFLKNLFNKNKNKSEQKLPVTNNEEVIIDEKELILQQINQEQLENFFMFYNFNKDTISIHLATILKDNPTLLSYFNNNIIDINILNKLNNNKLSISDIKMYNKELFQFDIFSDEEKNILEMLRTEVVITDESYAKFDFEDFINNIESPSFIEQIIPSLLGNESLVIESKKAIPINFGYSRFYNKDNIEVLFPLEKDKIFSEKIFDVYYSGDIQFDKNVILFISYDQFQEWITQEDKINILKNVQFVIKEDFSKSWEIYDKINLFNGNIVTNNNYYNNNLLIQVNHLLYVIDNSNLELNDKNYFRYYITEKFLKVNYSYYESMGKLQELASEIKKIIEENEITDLTKKFNELDIQEKTKNVEQIKFSADIFLNKFDNLNEISSFAFLNYVTSLNQEQRKEVLNNNFVINKLQGLLKESLKDPYYYYKIAMQNLSIEELFKIFNIEFIEEYYTINKQQHEYIFFYTLLNKDINETVKYLLTNDDYFKEFTKDINRYTFSNLDHSLLLELLRKIEKLNIAIDLSFLYSVNKTSQLNLLKENFSNDILVKIVKNCNREVQQFFYSEDKRFTYLYNKFDILDLSKSKYKFPNDIVYKNDFFDNFKSISMIKFRENINQFLIHQPSVFFEEKVDKYEDELISNYDINSGLFKQYEYLLNNLELLNDRTFIYKGIDFFYD